MIDFQCNTIFKPYLIFFFPHKSFIWVIWGIPILKRPDDIPYFTLIISKWTVAGARQRFQRCLKAGKTSPLLQEIVTVLEQLNITKKAQRKSDSSPPSQSVSDQPQLIMSSLSRLNDIMSGQFMETDKELTLNEILYYLEQYASPESPYIYLVKR